MPDVKTGTRRQFAPSGLDQAAGRPPAGRRGMHVAILSLVLAACGVFYLHSASFRTYGLIFTYDPLTYYGQLADSFLHGRLSLMTPPKPELLALKDPYDPALNVRYRFHDASLYRGKYYLYFGPVPALFLHIPFHWLTGVWPSDAAAVTMFLVVGTAFWLAVFHAGIGNWFPDIGPIWTLLGGLAIAFCSTGPFVLSRPKVYEVCLSASYCFVAIFFYMFQRAVVQGPTGRNLALAGMALALAVGCRPPVGLIAPLAAAILWRRFTGDRASLRHNARRLAAFAIPLATVGVLLAVYNYLRFDNPLQFGTSYQLALMKTRSLAWFSAARIPTGLYYYLWFGPQASLKFPFVMAVPTAIPGPAQPPPYVEPVIGILRLYPFLTALLVLPFAVSRAVKNRPGLLPALIALVGAGLMELMLLCCFAGYTMRYELEFVPPLVVASVLGISALRCSPSSWRWIRVLVAPALVAGALQGFLLGFTGYGDMWGPSYEWRHPGAVAAIQARLSPIENRLTRWFRGHRPAAPFPR